LGAFALAWEYSTFWCTASIKTGVHSGGMGAATLLDGAGDFLNLGVIANVGMRLYNLTQNTEGPITGVTQTTITATGVTWNTNDDYRVVTVDANEISTIDRYLVVTAADIHAALAASGACACVLAAWATEFLKKLNIIEAGVFHACPCAQPPITDAQRSSYLTWINTQLDNLRTGKLDVCEGATGSEFPATAVAEQSVTEFAAVRIINNHIVP
jgi:hypothetical protein